MPAQYQCQDNDQCHCRDRCQSSISARPVSVPCEYQCQDWTFIASKQMSASKQCPTILGHQIGPEVVSRSVDIIYEILVCSQYPFFRRNEICALRALTCYAAG